MSKKGVVAVTDLPSACRTWDDRRRAWVPKTRYATAAEARQAAGKQMHSYKCAAGSVGDHFHVGHASKGKRR